MLRFKGYRQYFRPTHQHTLLNDICGHSDLLSKYYLWALKNAHQVFIMNNDSDGWIKKHKDTTINQTNHSSVYRVIQKTNKKTAQPLVLISNNSRAPSQSQEHTNDQKVLFERENCVLHYQYQVSGSVHRLFFVKGRLLQEGLVELTEPEWDITPFKMPVTVPFAHSTPSLRVYV